MTIGQNSTLIERATYDQIPRDELIELITELEAGRNVDKDIDSPEEMKAQLEYIYEQLGYLCEEVGEEKS